MKNMKGGIPLGYLSGDAFNFFVFAFGLLLARAHARSGDAAVIAGYCGTSAVLGEALADLAQITKTSAIGEFEIQVFEPAIR